MRQVFKILIFPIMLFIVTSCYSGREVADSSGLIQPISTPGAQRDGSIVYGLPRTVFNVVVVMDRTIEKPGPYAAFAGDLLGLTDVIKSESESWAIESVTVKSHDELDPSEYYIISSNSLFQTNVLSLKKEGLILDLNPSIFSSNDKAGGSAESGNLLTHFADLGSDEYFQMQRDTAYKRMNVDSSFVRIPYIVEKKKKLPLDELAEKAAKRLMELRDGKHLILTGEATVFPQSDAAINEINRMEKAYTELFTGKTLKESFTFSYEIIPQKSMIGKPEVIFQFSDQTGPSKTGGKQVTMEFTPEKKTKDLAFIGKPKEDKKYDRLYYRVPDVVNVKVNLGSEKLLDSRKLIYQFGELVQLPANYLIGK
jgi:hypothetical protein